MSAVRHFVIILIKQPSHDYPAYMVKWPTNAASHAFFCELRADFVRR
jgi:hypothetical protein